jgi:hypothetical protein
MVPGARQQTRAYIYILLEISVTVAEARKYLEVIQAIPADQIGPLLRVGHPAPDLLIRSD